MNPFFFFFFAEITNLSPEPTEICPEPVLPRRLPKPHSRHTAFISTQILDNKKGFNLPSFSLWLFFTYVSVEMTPLCHSTPQTRKSKSFLWGGHYYQTKTKATPDFWSCQIKNIKTVVQVCLCWSVGDWQIYSDEPLHLHLIIQKTICHENFVRKYGLK